MVFVESPEDRMKKLFPALSLLLSFGVCYGEEPALEADESQEVALLESPLLQPESPLLNPMITHESLEMPENIPLRKRKNAALAGCMSTFIPGLGQSYLGDFKGGASYFGSTALLYGVTFSKIKNGTVKNSSFSTGWNLALYGTYAAYRDARIYNDHQGYNYAMPINSLKELTLAPFQWSIIKKPEVWGAFFGSLVIGGTISHFMWKDASAQIAMSSYGTRFPLTAFPVGIGEEAFFRGYLQSTLSEVLSPWGGIIASSLLFGAIHAPNATLLPTKIQKRYYMFALPYLTAAGVYFGWLAHKNRSLKEGVALHSWYDFTLFLLSYSAAQSAAIGKPSFAFSFSF